MNVVASFLYRDINGTVICTVKRIEPGQDGAKKEFLPYRSDRGDGKSGLFGMKLPIYNAPDVQAAIGRRETIYFTEGEGKGDVLLAALREAGSRAPVTTIAGGANALLLADHLASLRGATRVVFLADSDHPGGCAASERADRLVQVAPRCDVRIVDLYPDRSDGSDVADWLKEGHTVAELCDLVEAAPPVTQRPMTPISRNGTARVDEIPEFERLGILIERDDVPIEYALDGLLPLGGTAVLVGRPKGGKSTLALNLALAVARGESFLGRTTREGRVLYVALEGAPRGWKALARSLGVTPGDELYFWGGRAPEAAMAWLRGEVEKHEPVLVIVDTMQRLLRVKDGNDYATASNVTDLLIELARLTNAALLMLHHSGRNPSAEIVDAPMGSTAWSAAFDTILVLRKSERYRTLASEGRTGESFPETVIEMDPDTHCVTAAGTKAFVAETDMRTAIIEFLREYAEEHPDDPSADEKTINDGVEGRTKAKCAALRECVTLGQIVRSGTGKKGDRYKYGLSISLLPDCTREEGNENPESSQKANRDAQNAYSSLPEQMRIQQGDGKEHFGVPEPSPDLGPARTLDHPFTICEAADDGKLSACMECGGTWELHGSPASSEWKPIDNAADYQLSYAAERIVIEPARADQAGA